MGGGRAFVISMEDGIFNFLALKQGIKIITTQRRAMDRDIFTAIERLNETKSLRLIIPLDQTFNS